MYHANGSSNGYDNLNQLSAFARGTLNTTKDTISTPAHTQAWTPDALGNFTGVNTDGMNQTNTYNAQNEISTTGVTYDANGNLTADGTGKNYVYDAWNRLVQVKSGPTTLASYKYDGLNRRIVENPGTARDLYYSAAWQVLEERVGGVAKAQFVWSPVYVDALVERDRDANNSGTLSERLYAQQDANWNVTTLTDTSGNVVERYVYDPYGAVTVLNATWTAIGASAYAWVYLHQGGRFDPATGLYNFRNRDLSPSLGRLLRVDPKGFGAGDSNVYRYVGNNPTNATDPTGLFIIWPTPREIWDRITGNGGPKSGPKETKPSPFRLCQRNIIEQDVYDHCANKCGGQHTFIMYGDLDAKGNPEERTVGVGYAGVVGPNGAWHPNKIICYNRTTGKLAQGSGAGKRAIDATDWEIWDCIWKYPPRKPYQWANYNCRDWALEAMQSAGLEPVPSKNSGLIIFAGY